jgi:hypothetical protein
MMWVPLDGIDMQTAGAIYVTHAVAHLQRNPFLGRSAIVERVEELEEVLCPSMGLLYLLYLLGPHLELWKNGIVLLSAHTHGGDRLLPVEAPDSWHGAAREHQ